jgi:adenylate cyclase
MQDIPSKNIPRKIDFQTVPAERFEKDGKLFIKFQFIPSPNRYEPRTVDGIDCYYDKFEDSYISKMEIEEAIKSKKGKGIYSVVPRTIRYDEYINIRHQTVLDFLDGKEQPYRRADISEDFLVKLKRDYEMKFAILCVDIKGSTVLSQQLSTQRNAILIDLFAKEMSAIVSNYRGYVLKYVGDGLIAYFPIFDYVPMDDAAVDCAMAMKYYIEHFLNEILPTRQFPELTFRIGIDSGEAVLKDIGDPSNKQHKDLIGLTINLASKIQGRAKENGILIGDTTLRGLHADKRTFFTKQEEYPMSENGSPYPLHALSKYPDKQSIVILS